MTGAVQPRVALVGAGVGSADLLTVRAARLIAQADVILHDRLVSSDVLALARAGAHLVDVGKGPGDGTVGLGYPQARINELLVLYALDGGRVVRLKSGDPFVFGRGREEADALDAADISWEVVPGVTSALAAPALAGIPVTHRSLAASFTVVTASRAAGEPDVDWAALARVGGTIVVLMGAARRAHVADALIAGGLAPDTPVAAVVDAGSARQRVLTGALDQLADLSVRSPTVIVIGAVARFADAASDVARTALSAR